MKLGELVFVPPHSGASPKAFQRILDAPPGTDNLYPLGDIAMGGGGGGSGGRSGGGFVAPISSSSILPFNLETVTTGSQHSWMQQTGSDTVRIFAPGIWEEQINGSLDTGWDKHVQVGYGPFQLSNLNGAGGTHDAFSLDIWHMGSVLEVLGHTEHSDSATLSYQSPISASYGSVWHASVGNSMSLQEPDTGFSLFHLDSQAWMGTSVAENHPGGFAAVGISEHDWMRDDKVQTVGFQSESFAIGFEKNANWVGGGDMSPLINAMAAFTGDKGAVFDAPFAQAPAIDAQPQLFAGDKG